MSKEQDNLSSPKTLHQVNTLFIVGLVFFGFILGIFLGFLINGTLKSDSESTILRENGYEFISPLLDVEPRDMTTIKKISDLEDNLNDLIFARDTDEETDQTTTVSIYFKELSSGAWIGINEKELFTPASLLKLPLMMAYYKIAESDRTILSRELIFKNISDGYTQNIESTSALKDGTPYTVDEIINTMIIHSDNHATQFLINKINDKDLRRIYGDLAIKNPSDTNVSDFISVKDYAGFFRILYNSSYLNKEMSTKALKLLAQVNFRRGLASGIPHEIIVAHKFGERGFEDSSIKQLHDCGIVYVPKKPYIICVMTRGESLVQLEKIIQKISNLVYKSVAN